MYRIIFGECDMELFQAKPQLGFVFFYIYTRTTAHGFKNISLQFYGSGSGALHLVQVVI